METTKRQSRRTRTRSKDNVQLSTRDLKIFQALHRHRYLRSTFLEAFAGGEHTNFLYRLRCLFDAGYIGRPSQQWLYANAYYQPTVYELDRKGEDELKSRALFTHQLRRSVADPGHLFHHDLMVSDCIASIEIACMQMGLRFIDAEEILSRSTLDRIGFSIGSRRLVPDGLFGIESQEGVILYAVEADRKTEQLTERESGGSSYDKKLKEYAALIKTGAYKEQLNTKAGLLVLHITVAEPRMKRMMTLSGASRFNLFRTVPFDAFDRGRPVPALLTNPWLREGHAPFNISGKSS